MSREIEQGKRAEDLALEWLLSCGFILKDRNWRCVHREIDLIMERGPFLHIVEVKSLRLPSVRAPFEQVDWRKRYNLIRAARRYVVQKRVSKEVVFDIVSITFDGEEYRLEYIPNAFLPIS